MIALDTNVLIYCCDERDPRRQQIALDLVAETTEGVLPWQVACEFIAASRKLADQGFTASQAWQRLAEFLGLLPLLMPTPAVLERRSLTPHRAAVGILGCDAGQRLHREWGQTPLLRGSAWPREDRVSGDHQPLRLIGTTAVQQG